MSVTVRGAYSTVEVALDPPVARVTLNRPAVRNAFNGVMIGELTAAFMELGGREDVAGIVLRGAGSVFCAGADIEWMRASLQYSHDDNMEDARRMAAMFDTIDRVPQPVVTLVQGAALGGGMGLLAASDIVIAAEDTVFGFTETKLGIVPAVISSLVLPKIGPTWARALYVTGERFSAGLAQRIGLVHWIVPPGDLDAAAAAKLEELRTSGPRAMRVAKRLACETWRLDPESLRAYAARTLAEVRTSDEGQEGLHAFLEKRAPGWRA